MEVQLYRSVSTCDHEALLDCYITSLVNSSTVVSKRHNNDTSAEEKVDHHDLVNPNNVDEEKPFYLNYISMLTSRQFLMIVQQLSNSPAPADFVLYPDEHVDDAPVFDVGAGGSLLHLACIHDNVFALSILLAFGADSSSRHTTFRRLPIHEASCWGSTACLDLLLWLSKDQDPNVNVGSKMFCLPSLQQTRPYLSYTGQIELATNLAKGIQSNQFTPLEASKKLLNSVTLPHDRLMMLLNAQLVPDGHGNTPLHWAAFKNRIEAIEILLREGADPNVRSVPSGWTPLHDAAYANSSESIKILVQAGADVDAAANSGATPLCFAAQEDALNALVTLLEMGADAEVRSRGQPPLQLFQNGAVMNIPLSRFSGYTPLHYCAHYNTGKTARALLAHGISTEIRDVFNRLPIHIAASRGSSDVLRELLKFGAYLDTRPSSENNLVLNPIQNILQNRSSRQFTSPPTSPVLRAMIPKQPVLSSKRWNCLEQRSIDECRQILNAVEESWSPSIHSIFTPTDRRCIMELLRVGKRFEQDLGVYLDLWPFVLSFCFRGWFEKDDNSKSSGSNPERCNNGFICSLNDIPLLRLDENYNDAIMDVDEHR